MKKIAISIMILAIFSAMFCAAGITEIRPDSVVVVETDYSTDTLVLETATGMIFTYEGIEDIFIGDLVSVSFDDNDTPDITDDVVLKLEYSGFWMDIE